MFRRTRLLDILSHSWSGQNKLLKGCRRREREATRSELRFETLELRCLLAIDVFSSALSSLENPEIAYSLAAPDDPIAVLEESSTPYPLEDTFFLNSNPNSLKNIYLDFNGHTTVGTAWNESYDLAQIVSSPYDSDGSPYDSEGNPDFSDSELAEIQRIWERVVEDFRPFDVNVTTQDPGVDSLRNTSGGSAEYGIRVVMTDDNFVGPGVGGIAYLTSFDWDSDTPCFAFNDGEKAAAETVSHEVGHTLSLRHDGRYPPLEEYYSGHGTGETSWGAIMGAAFSPNVVQWSKGEYPNANNGEDDLYLINQYLDYVPDDHGSSIGTTTSKLTRVDYFIATGEGVIERNTDVDYFAFTTDGGNVEFEVSPFYRGPNLDIGVTIYASNGALVDSSSPDDTLGVSFTKNLSAGNYYLAIEGTGKPAEPGDPGYTDYGSLGYYSITVTQPYTVKGVDLLSNYFNVVDPVDSLGAAVVATVDFTTLNRGDTASGEFDLSFYLSDDDDIDPATDVLLELHPFDPHYDETQPEIYTVVGGLAAGDSLTQSVVLLVPEDDPFGTDDSYYIGIVSDVSSEVLEVVESNNHSNGAGIDLQNVRFSTVLHTFDLDTQPIGWTTEGEWEFGTPTGQGGALFGHPDPQSGATGTNVFGVDLDGDYNLSVGGPWYLTTQAMDFSDFDNVTLEFKRWLNTDFQNHAVATVEVSNDGENWTTLFANPTGKSIADASWQTMQYDISAVGDLQSEVYVRWGYKINENAFPYAGWNIDDIVFLGTPLNGLLGEVLGNVWGDVDADGMRDPEDLGLEGWSVFLDENNNGIWDSESNVIVSEDVPIAIVDNGTVTSSLDVSGVIGTIDSLTVQLDISHQFDADLDVYLISPKGTRVQLFTDVGGAGDNFISTVLDDTASTPITSGSAPFTGTYSPEVPLGTLAGEDPTGLWSLEITDDRAGIAGTLNSWSLTLNTSERSTLSDANGEYSFTDLPSDFYKVLAELQTGWTQTLPSGSNSLISAVGPGQVVANRDFAFTTDSEIHGVLWNDVDGNGSKNGEESYLEGQIVYIDDNGNGQLDIEYVDFQSSEVPVDILDDDTVTSTILIEDTNLILADINVTLDISHTYDGDLDVFLISPSNTRVELFSDVGTIGTGFSNTTLDDDASVLITDGDLPYSGTFRPIGTLADFIASDLDPSGTWTLEITDDQSGDVGTLNSWSLSIGTSSEPFAFTDADGAYSFDDILPGEYELRQILQQHWVQTYPLTATQTVVVGPDSTVGGVDFGSREGPSADFNGDNLVTALDFFILQRGYGRGTTLAEGDADDNSQVDSLDIDIWESEYDQYIPVLPLVEEEATSEVSGQPIASLASAGSGTNQSTAAISQYAPIANHYDQQLLQLADSKLLSFESADSIRLPYDSNLGNEAPASSARKVFGRELFAFAPFSSLLTRHEPFRVQGQFEDGTTYKLVATDYATGELPRILLDPLENKEAIDDLFGDGETESFRFDSACSDEDSDWLAAVAEAPAGDGDNSPWSSWQ